MPLNRCTSRLPSPRPAALQAHPDFWSGRLRQREAARDTLAFFRGTVRNKNGAAYSRGIRIELEQAGCTPIFKTRPPSADCNPSPFFSSCCAMRKELFLASLSPAATATATAWACARAPSASVLVVGPLGHCVRTRQAAAGSPMKQLLSQPRLSDSADARQ